MMSDQAKIRRHGPFLWWQHRRSAAFDVFVTLSVTFLAIGDATSSAPHLSAQTKFSLDLLVLGAGLALILRRRLPLPVLGISLVPLATGYSDLLLPVALYSLALYGRSERRLVVIAPAVGLITLLAYSFNPLKIPEYRLDSLYQAGILLFSVVAVVATPTLLGVYIRARRRLVAELRERAERLERERHLLATQALAEERSRIAREMHDVAAHRIGLLVIYSGVLESAAETDPTEVRRIAGEIGDAGRDALQEIRDVVGVLRLTESGRDDTTTPSPRLAQLPDMVERYRAAGLPTTLHMDGITGRVPEAAQRSVFRIVQEALSNVHKHAGAVTTDVVVSLVSDVVEVTVRNAPPHDPPPVTVPRGGNGLVGMRERVSLHGGEFTAHPLQDGGFEVAARIPVAAPEGA